MFKAKEYIKVHSLEEAYQLNQKKGNLIVGGMMWLKMENNLKITAIDLSALGLDTIEETEEEFQIGAMCTLRMLETHEGFNQYFDHAGKECVRHIVGVQFRNGATVGGSIFGRYGFSDLLTCMMALNTYVELYHGGIVPLDEFSLMPYDNDILVRILVKKDGRKTAYRNQRRSKTDFPLIACGVSKLSSTWYFSVGARPAKARLVKIEDQDDREILVKEVMDKYDFFDNVRASGNYRKAVTEVYLKRLITEIESREA